MNKLKFLLSLIVFSAINFLLIFLSLKQMFNMPLFYESRFIILLVSGLISIVLALIPTFLFLRIKKGVSRSIIVKNIIYIMIYFIVYYTLSRGLFVIPCC